MLKLFLWLRYLRKRRLVLLSIAAVALSVSLLMVVASLFTGFIDAYETIAVDVLGDVVLEPPARFAGYQLFIDRLEQLHAVDAATASLSTQGLLFVNKGNVRAVQVVGIDPAGRAKVTAFKDSLLRQKSSTSCPSFAVPDQPGKLGGIVGIAIVEEPDELTDEYDFTAAEQMIGKRVVLTTGSVIEQDDPAGEGPARRFKRRTIPFTVADVAFSGFYDLDKRYVFLPIEKLQQTLYPDAGEPIADEIQIKLTPGTEPHSAIAQIRGAWEAFVDDRFDGETYLKRYVRIETAKDLQSRYVAEIRKQMGVLLLIFGVVSASVVVLVFCIFYMIVTTKRKDIAIIKSCGTPSGSVAWIFVGFGACVGIVGSAAGTILGCIITSRINTIEHWIRIIFGLKLWKSSIYMFSRIPNEVNWPWTLPIVLSAVAAAAVGTLIPAIVAAKTKPVEILRYE